MTAPLFLSLAIIGLTLLGWTSQWLWPSWPMDLASSFQVQYAIANLLLWLLLLRSGLQRRTPAIYAGLLIGLTCISFQIAMLGHWYRPAIAIPPAASAQPIKILSSNVHPGMTDYGPLLNLIEQEQPDFVLLQEATALSLEQLRSFSSLLPYSLDKVPPGDRQPGEKYPPKGTAIFSRFPLTAQSSKPDSPEDQAGLLAQVQTNAASPTSSAAPEPWLQIFAVHALVPIRPNFYRQRNDQMAAVFHAAQHSQLPTVTMGDFNTSLWSSQLSAIKTAPLRPVRQGFGIKPSWRPNLAFPPGLQWIGHLFWTPIDHSYISQDITVQDFRLGPDVKSDHLPVIVELKIPA